MSRKQQAGWGLLVCWACAGWAAAEVPIDRPSPPPYCADGRCYPKTSTWGFYQGRWRTWPGVAIEPTAPAAEPTPAEVLGPDLKPYETPRPQDEDLRAPPPTKKPEAPPAPATPPAAQPPKEEEGAAQPSARPPIMPIPPSGVRPPSGEESDMPPPLPFETPPSSSPFDSVPPLPPVGTPLLPNEDPSGPLPNIPGELPLEPEMQLRRDPMRAFPTDDPPPPLPSAWQSLVSN